MVTTRRPVKESAKDSAKEPAKEPAKVKPFMKAQFADLVAVNFHVDEKILQPLVPPGLELDNFNGEAYVSLVAMMLKGAKVWGLPFSIVPSSAELSLRFYVKHTHADGVEKGTCLIKDYVAGSTAAWFLESQFQSTFSKLKMKQTASGFAKGETPEVEYQWKVDERWNKLRVRARSRIKKTSEGTKVGFILDHFNYYGRHNGRTLAYRVERPRWDVWDAAQANFTCDVQRLFGKSFVRPLAKRPASVFVTSGSPVTIFKPVVIK
jgi:uncharacterized protein YqjF (DUF2071 family)